jgi:hypothetical protein
MMRALPRHLPVAVETPNVSLNLNARERAARGLFAARKIMEAADAQTGRVESFLSIEVEHHHFDGR